MIGWNQFVDLMKLIKMEAGFMTGARSCGDHSGHHAQGWGWRRRLVARGDRGQDLRGVAVQGVCAHMRVCEYDVLFATIS